MFKILHTSDWHLGHQFHRYDREDEFRAFFSALRNIVETERPDVLCISGDIFDTLTPPLGALNLWSEFLADFNSAYPEMTIVAIAGNHDSGSKLAVYADLLRDGIFIVGRNHRTLRVTGRDGSTAVICAVPYIADGYYKSRLDAEPADGVSPMRAFFEMALREGESLRADVSEPLILLAHLAVTDSDFRGQDRYRFNFHDIDELTDGFDYVALGHIHYPQNVVAEGAVRYSGSPIAMSFDEDYDHSLTIVEFDNSTISEVRTIQLSQPRAVLTLPADKPLDATEVDDFLQSFDYSIKSYVRIQYLDDGNFTASLRRRIENEFAAHGDTARLCLLQPVSIFKADEEERSVLEGNDMSALTLANARDIAADHFRKINGYDMPRGIVSLLNEVISDSDEVP